MKQTRTQTKSVVSPKRQEHLSMARECVQSWEREHTSNEHLIERIAELLDECFAEGELVVNGL